MVAYVQDLGHKRFVANSATDTALAIGHAGSNTDSVVFTGNGLTMTGSVPLVWGGEYVPIALTTGTDTAPTAGLIHYISAMVPCAGTFTGISILNGSVVGTHKVIVGVYSAAGVLLASSDLAGTDTTDDAAFEKIAFTATVNLVGPQRVLLAMQWEGTTPRYRATAAGIVIAGSQAGAFGTMAAISSPSAVVGVGPICNMY